MASPSEPENGTKDSVVMANLIEKSNKNFGRYPLPKIKIFI